MSNIIPIYIPYIEKYKNSALDAINSGWISNYGKYIELATNKLKEILNTKNIILMSNGTCATHCLLLALKYKYPNINKIYVPNNVYVAVYNCVLMEYNIDLIEILKTNEDTWCIDESEEYLLSLEKNSAILIVHNLGGIVNVDRIKKIRPDIILLEDNCEGLFGKYNNIYTGTSENVLCSSISFYANKTITTGEGGAFITNDDEIYNYIKLVYSQGMSSIRYIHNLHAYNYRMTNIEAAFLYDQLNDIEHILELKNKIFNNYLELLKELIDSNKISLQKINDNCIRANWMFAIKINNNKLSIDETYKYFYDNGIETRPFFYPYYYHNHLKTIKSQDTINKLNENILMFPSYPNLKFENQQYIVNIINKLIK